MKPITAVEYQKAVEMARENDRGIGGIANMARVLLALAGFYNDTVADMCSRKDHDGLRDIESGYGLPVDGALKPCPECGGYEVVANGEYFTSPCLRADLARVTSERDEARKGIAEIAKAWRKVDVELLKEYGGDYPMKLGRAMDALDEALVAAK
jgi:hypothetical protein